MRPPVRVRRPARGRPTRSAAHRRPDRTRGGSVGASRAPGGSRRTVAVARSVVRRVRPGVGPCGGSGRARRRGPWPAPSPGPAAPRRAAVGGWPGSRPAGRRRRRGPPARRRRGVQDGRHGQQDEVELGPQSLRTRCRAAEPTSSSVCVTASATPGRRVPAGSTAGPVELAAPQRGGDGQTVEEDVDEPGAGRSPGASQHRGAQVRLEQQHPVSWSATARASSRARSGAPSPAAEARTTCWAVPSAARKRRLARSRRTACVRPRGRGATGPPLPSPTRRRRTASRGGRPPGRARR